METGSYGGYQAPYASGSYLVARGEQVAFGGYGNVFHLLINPAGKEVLYTTSYMSDVFEFGAFANQETNEWTKMTPNSNGYRWKQVLTEGTKPHMRAGHILLPGENKLYLEDTGMSFTY